ncbi:MAG: GAF domain-containing protein [Chloroflexota bacterium]
MSTEIHTKEELIKTVEHKLNGLKDALGCDLITMHLYDSERERLYLPIGVNLFDKQRFSRSAPSMDRVVGKVIRQQKSIIAGEAEHHPDMTGPFTHLEKIKSAVGFPLLVPSVHEVIGAVFVDYRQSHQFSDDELQKISEFTEALGEFIYATFKTPEGRQLRIALRRETDFQRKDRRLQEVLKNIQTVLGDVDVILWTQKDQKGELKVNVGLGVDQSLLQCAEIDLHSDSENLVVDSFLNDNECEIDNLSQNPKQLFNTEDALPWERAYLTPVVSDYHKLGVLCILRRDGRLEFSQREIDEIRTFSRLIAVTIRNEERIIILSALHDLGVRLTLASDVRSILQEIVRNACLVVGADIATVHLYDHHKQEFFDLDHAAVYPEELRQYMEKPRARGGLTNAIVRKQRAYVENIDEVEDQEKVSTFIRDQGIKAYLGMPLITGNQSVGVIYVSFKQPRRFSPDELSLVQILANHAATAIYRANLSYQRDAVTKIAQTIASSLDSDEILQFILDQSLQLLHGQEGLIALFDRQTDELVFQYAKGKQQWTRISINEGLMGAAARSKEPVRVGDVTQDTRYKAHVSNTRSELDVPLLVGDELVGVLNMESHLINAFTEEDENLATILASQAAIAIANARLFKESKTRAEALKSLHEVAPALVSISDAPESLGKILTQIAENAQRVLGADLVDLYQYTQSRDEFALPVQAGDRNDTTVVKDKIYKDDVVYSILGSEKPIFNIDAQKETTLIEPFTEVREDAPDERFVIREDIKSMAAIKLVVDNQVMGILFANYRTPQTFAQDQRDLIDLFANQAAIAIRNARMYADVQQRVKDLDILNYIGQELTRDIHLTKNEVLEVIYEQAQKLTDTRDMYIALYDEDSNQISFGLAMEGGERVEVGIGGWATREADMEKRGKTEEIILTREPILHNNLDKSTNWYGQPGHAEFLDRIQSSYLGVPLVLGDRVLGVIALYDWEHEYAFDEQDLQVIQTMAGQAAIALSNATLFYDVNRELERRVEDLNALTSVGRELSASLEMESDEVLEVIYKQAQKLTDTRDMYIALYDEDSNQISFGLAMEGGERVEVGIGGWATREADMEKRGKTEEIILTHEPILHKTLDKSTNWYGQPSHAEFLDKVALSWLGVPLVLGDRVLGVIALYDWEHEYAFDEQNQWVIQTMADLAAIALENARLFIAEQNWAGRLKALNEVSQELTASLDPERVWSLILEKAAQLTDAHYSTIQIIDDAEDELVLSFVHPPEEKPIDETFIRIPVGRGITGWVAEHRKSLLVRNVTEDDRYLEYLSETCSELAVPLFVDGRLIGVLNVEHREVGGLDKQDQELLTTFANQAAVAIQNARHVETLREEQDRRTVAEKYAYLGYAADGIAHRINNTIALLPLCVTDIKDRLGTTDSYVEEQLDMIERNARYILELAQELQKPSGAKNLTSFNINGLLEDALKFVVVPEDVNIDLVLASGLPKVYTNRLIVDVFVELITNAVVAMETAETKSLEIGSQKIDVSHVELWFKDSGPGVSLNEQERLFDLFYTNAKKGTCDQGVSKGFGLWWARTFLTWQDGEITIESIPGQGATFRIYLPLEVK